MSGKAALLCSWGGSFGSGHLQRMASLLFFLRRKGFDPYLVTSADSFPLHDLAGSVYPEISRDTTLIIRDSRDSTKQEIDSLKETAPVVAIDDLGEGRASADMSIDMLPNLIYHQNWEDNPFIYGYSFSKAITESVHTEIVKNIDFCVYAGFGASEEYILFLKELLPFDSRSVILDGVSAVEVCSGKEKFSELKYPEILLSSSSLLSHFGISLFEGSLCSCGTFAINPAEYHSKLADLAGAIIGTENFGVYSSLDTARVKNSLKEAASVQKRCIRISDVREKIDLGLNLFYEKIQPLL